MFVVAATQTCSKVRGSALDCQQGVNIDSNVFIFSLFRIFQK